MSNIRRKLIRAAVVVTSCGIASVGAPDLASFAAPNDPHWQQEFNHALKLLEDNKIDQAQAIGNELSHESDVVLFPAAFGVEKKLLQKSDAAKNISEKRSLLSQAVNLESFIRTAGSNHRGVAQEADRRKVTTLLSLFELSEVGTVSDQEQADVEKSLSGVFSATKVANDSESDATSSRVDKIYRVLDWKGIRAWVTSWYPKLEKVTDVLRKPFCIELWKNQDDLSLTDSELSACEDFRTTERNLELSSALGIASESGSESGSSVGPDCNGNLYFGMCGSAHCKDPAKTCQPAYAGGCECVGPQISSTGSESTISAVSSASTGPSSSNQISSIVSSSKSETSSGSSRNSSSQVSSVASSSKSQTSTQSTSATSSSKSSLSSTSTESSSSCDPCSFTGSGDMNFGLAALGCSYPGRLYQFSKNNCGDYPIDYNISSSPPWASGSADSDKNGIDVKINSLDAVSAIQQGFIDIPPGLSGKRSGKISVMLDAIDPSTGEEVECPEEIPVSAEFFWCGGIPKGENEYTQTVKFKPGGDGAALISMLQSLLTDTKGAAQSKDFDECKYPPGWRAQLPAVCQPGNFTYFGPTISQGPIANPTGNYCRITVDGKPSTYPSSADITQQFSITIPTVKFAPLLPFADSKTNFSDPNVQKNFISALVKVLGLISNNFNGAYAEFLKSISSRVQCTCDDGSTIAPSVALNWDPKHDIFSSIVNGTKDVGVILTDLTATLQVHVVCENGGPTYEYKLESSGEKSAVPACNSGGQS